MLQQADAMTTGAVATPPGAVEAPAGAVSAPAPAAATASAVPTATAALPLEQAILGTWRSDLAGMTYEFRADGTAAASSTRHGAREQRWTVAGPGTIRIDDSTLQVAVEGDALALGEPPRSLTFHRVG